MNIIKKLKEDLTTSNVTALSTKQLPSGKDMLARMHYKRKYSALLSTQKRKIDKIIDNIKNEDGNKI